MVLMPALSLQGCLVQPRAVPSGLWIYAFIWYAFAYQNAFMFLFGIVILFFAENIYNKKEL